MLAIICSVRSLELVQAGLDALLRKQLTSLGVPWYTTLPDYTNIEDVVQRNRDAGVADNHNLFDGADLGALKMAIVKQSIVDHCNLMHYCCYL